MTNTNRPVPIGRGEKLFLLSTTMGALIGGVGAMYILPSFGVQPLHAVKVGTIMGILIAVEILLRVEAGESFIGGLIP